MDFRWSAIAARLPGRTDNEIKNYWNTHIRKRLLRMGIDPVTHTPRIDLLDLPSILTAAICSHPLLSLSTLLNNNQAAGLNSESLRLISTLLAIKQEDPNDNRFLLQAQAQAQLQAQMDTLSQLLQPNDNVNNANASSMPISTTFVECPNSQENLNFLASNLSGGDVLVNQPNYVYGENGSNGSNPTASDLPEIWNNDVQNLGFDCGISTPKSSPTPLNSSSTCVNNSSSSNEDERDSYRSNFLQFEIPEGLDFADLM